MGSIAMDNSHNIALGYSKSSTTVKPGIYITGRLSGDTHHDGRGSNGPCRDWCAIGGRWH